MVRNVNYRIWFLSVGVGLFTFRAVCGQDIDVLSLSNISGSVNGSTVEGIIRASINTDRGGNSTCEFSQLPEGFTPGTFSTHT
jgi:hypothetical protein